MFNNEIYLMLVVDMYLANLEANAAGDLENKQVLVYICRSQMLAETSMIHSPRLHFCLEIKIQKKLLLHICHNL